MDNRLIIKNILRDRICNTCSSVIEVIFGDTYCGLPGMWGGDFPEENTCSRWSPKSEKVWRAR